MFPEVSGNIPLVIDENREAARRFYAEAMAQRGVSRAAIAQQASVDPKTLRAFLSGERWPQQETRSALCLAVGWPADELDYIEYSGVRRDAPASVTPLRPAQIRPTRDAINEVAVRLRPGEDGGGSYIIGKSLGESADGSTESRLELRFWPGEGRKIAAIDLIGVVGDAHRAALHFVVADVEDETTAGGDGNADDTRGSAPTSAADSELSAAPDELPAAAKEGVIEESGEFNT